MHRPEQRDDCEAEREGEKLGGGVAQERVRERLTFPDRERDVEGQQGQRDGEDRVGEGFDTRARDGLRRLRESVVPGHVAGGYLAARK